MLIATLLTFCILSTTVFVARLVSRLGILRMWKLEDTLLAMAWVVAVSISIVAFVATIYGSGRPFRRIPLRNVPMLTKLNFYLSAAFNPVLFLSKLSICVNYLRIFYSYTRDRYAIAGCMIFLTISLIGVQLLILIPCIPIVYPWQYTRNTPVACQDPRLSLFSSFLTNVLTDLWVMFVAYNRILNLRLERRSKIAVLVVISMGWLAVAAAIARLANIMSITVVIQGRRAMDLSFAAIDIEIWTGLEMYVSIFCAAAPATLPLIKRLWPDFGQVPPEKSMACKGVDDAGVAQQRQRELQRREMQARLKREGLATDDDDDNYDDDDDDANDDDEKRMPRISRVSRHTRASKSVGGYDDRARTAEELRRSPSIRIIQTTSVSVTRSMP